MTSILAHGGTAGLAAELGLLSLPLIGIGVLWWWNRRLSREQAEGAGSDEERPASGGPAPG